MFTHRIDDHTELRLLQRYHADELYALVDANRGHLGRWLPWVEETLGVENTRRFIAEQLAIHANGKGLVAGIWHGGRLAGTIGLADINTHVGKAEIGYWLGKEFEGKGLMTLACRAMIEHAFTTLGLNRIQIRCEPENTRSAAIAKRLGFRHEGTMRAVGRIGERMVDLDVYALLRVDWAQGCPR